MKTPRAGRFSTGLVCVAIGAFLYTIASPPYEWSGAGWFALTPLFLVVRRETTLGATLAGFLYGLLSCAGIAYWLYPAISAYFPVSFPVGLLLTIAAYGFFTGSYMGVAAGLARVLMATRRPLLGCIGIPALWVSGEIARSSLFSGFSWWLLGYTQYRQLSLIQISDITGVYGVSFLLALNGYATAEALVFLSQYWRAGERHARPPWPQLGTALASTALFLLYGSVRMRQPFTSVRPAVTVALVQADVPSEERWQRINYGRSLLAYAEATRRAVAGRRVDLVVWPEFALGFYLDREYALRAQLSRLARGLDTFLLLGAPRLEDSGAGQLHYNSAYLMAPDGDLRGVYDKIRLLPFAEYSPLGLPSLLRDRRERPTEFVAGRRPTIFSIPRGRFGVMICYEATYPDVARVLARDGAEFLVNISNDTWLAAGGRTAATQHFAMSVFRAVENRRALVRVATSGISGLIEPTGVIRDREQLREGSILVDVSPRREMTPYTRHGDWFAWGCGGAAFMALARAWPETKAARV